MKEQPKSIGGGGMWHLAFTVLSVVFLTGCTIEILTNPSPAESVPPLSTDLPYTATSVDPPVANSTEGAEGLPTQVQEPLPSTEEGDAILSDGPHQCPPGINLPAGIDPKYCANIPQDAVGGNRAERFITPSGNIACDMQSGSVMCEASETTMIEDFHNPDGDGQCNGYLLTDDASHLCHSEPALWDGFDIDPTAWPELPYGDTIFVDERVCAIEETGLTCWNSNTGHGFQLSRLSYTHW